MLSNDCEDCSQLEGCSKRYRKATKGDTIFCPDGTAHIVSEPISSIDFCLLRM